MKIFILSCIAICSTILLTAQDISMIKKDKEEAIVNPEVLKFDSLYAVEVGKEYLIENEKVFMITDVKSVGAQGCWGRTSITKVDWTIDGQKNGNIKPTRPTMGHLGQDYGSVGKISIEVIRIRRKNENIGEAQSSLVELKLRHENRASLAMDKHFIVEVGKKYVLPYDQEFEIIDAYTTDHTVDEIPNEKTIIKWRVGSRESMLDPEWHSIEGKINFGFVRDLAIDVEELYFEDQNHSSRKIRSVKLKVIKAGIY